MLSITPIVRFVSKGRRHRCLLLKHSYARLGTSLSPSMLIPVSICHWDLCLLLPYCAGYVVGPGRPTSFTSLCVTCRRCTASNASSSCCKSERRNSSNSLGVSCSCRSNDKKGASPAATAAAAVAAAIRRTRRRGRCSRAEAFRCHHRALCMQQPQREKNKQRPAGEEGKPLNSRRSMDEGIRPCCCIVTSDRRCHTHYSHLLLHCWVSV